MKIKCPKCWVHFIIPPDEYNGINRCELCRFEFTPSNHTNYNQKDDSNVYINILNRLDCIDSNNQYYSKEMLMNQDKIINLLEEISLKLDELSKQI